MNAESIALNAYLRSDQGNAVCDPTTIKAPASQRQFLENRIRLAFSAGMDVGKKITLDRVKLKLSALVDDAVRSMP